MTASPEDESLAAEYALGVLDAGERAVVSARRMREPQLDAAILAWEGRLAPLLELVPGIEPAPDLYDRIEARITDPAPSPVIDMTGPLRARLARWRAATMTTGAVAAALALAVVFQATHEPTTTHQFVAVLQKSADAPAFALTVDIDKREFTVRPVAATAPAGKSYELWMIEPKLAAPRSLGLLNTDGVRRDRKLGDTDAAVVMDATYAVTVEPEGGSPNGKPSGDPVFYGKLIPVGP